MLAIHKMNLDEKVLSTFTKEELFWLNGYIAGKYPGATGSETVQTAGASINKLTITYGTETGNSKKLASEFAAMAKKNGIKIYKNKYSILNKLLEKEVLCIF